MASKPPIDPMAMMQALASAWKQVVPPTQASADPEVAAARLMAQTLAAANMPSREEVSDIAARLTRIEDTLGRIERALAPKPEPAAAPVPKTRKPKV